MFIIKKAIQNSQHEELLGELWTHDIYAHKCSELFVSGHVIWSHSVTRVDKRNKYLCIKADFSNRIKYVRNITLNFKRERGRALFQGMKQYLATSTLSIACHWYCRYVGAFANSFYVLSDAQDCLLLVLQHINKLTVRLWVTNSAAPESDLGKLQQAQFL